MPKQGKRRGIEYKCKGTLIYLVFIRRAVPSSGKFGLLLRFVPKSNDHEYNACTSLKCFPGE